MWGSTLLSNGALQLRSFDLGLYLVFRCQLRLIFSTQRVELSLPDTLDFGLVDLLLFSDIVSVRGLRSILRLSYENIG